MTKNHKIVNTNPKEYNGIQFKSTLEVRIYKTLVEYNIIPEYEKHTYTLINGFVPTVPFFDKTKKKGFHIITKPVAAITYTPDFVFNYEDILVIVEVKGFENDVFPLKKKLFRRLLEDVKSRGQKVMFFEVYTKADLVQSLTILSMNKQLDVIKSKLNCLTEKDEKLGIEFIEKRKFSDLEDLVSSAIIRAKKGKMKEDPKYENINIDNIRELLADIVDYINKI